MPATSATGARRSAGRARRHPKPLPRPQPLRVPSSQLDCRNESEHRDELLRATFRRQGCRQCAFRHAPGFPHRFPDAISSERRCLQAGERQTRVTSCVPQDGADPLDKLFKALFRFSQLFLSGKRQPVILGLAIGVGHFPLRSEEHTSELQSHSDLVCRLLLEKKKKKKNTKYYYIQL